MMVLGGLAPPSQAVAGSRAYHPGPYDHDGFRGPGPSLPGGSRKQGVFADIPSSLTTERTVLSRLTLYCKVLDQIKDSLVLDQIQSTTTGPARPCCGKRYIKVKVKVGFLHSAAYAMTGPARFTISEVAVDWREPVVLQRKLRPSIARVNVQLDPRYAASKHTTTPINRTRPSPRKHSPDVATRARKQTSDYSLLLTLSQPAWLVTYRNNGTL